MTEPGSGQPAEPPLLSDDLYVFANKRLVRGASPVALAPGEFPHLASFQTPADPGDSGWALFVGDETQEDADDPDNFQVNLISTIRAVHPQLRQILREGVTGYWEWDHARQEYVRDD